MANWIGTILTNKGKTLQGKVEAGKCKLELTKMKIGSGILENGRDLEGLIELIHSEQEIGLSEIETMDTGECVVHATLSNINVKTGFYARELGLYATDPDEGEILYAITTDGNPDYIQAYGGTTTISYDIALTIIVDNATHTVATIDPEGLVTEAKLQRHDADTAAHTALATTIDDNLVPTSDTNTIRNLVSNLANRIKAATGAGGWKEAPAATLASLSTMIANLATGADVTWDGKKFTNHRLGITGLMDQNGYICFGPNCGSLIIQWVTENKTIGNDEGTYVMLPLTFPTKCVTALLSDTYGRLSNSSAMANQTEGAKVNTVTINSVQIISYWSGGLDTAVTVLAIGY